jgi:diguanylate cyclase (GGDEF)-like protein/PAS domain S-box-containing protein
MRDITTRTRAERALRQSEADLAEAQKIAHLGSWSVEPPKPGMPRERRGMHWSDEMYRIFGFAPQEFVPNSESPIESIHPQDREYVSRVLQDTILRGEPSLTIEHRVIRPDGEVRFVQAQMENVFDEDGELLRRFGTVLDITDGKQAEEALRLSESRLLAAQRIAHVGNWSFDVNNNEAHWSDEMYRIFGLEPREELTLTYKGFLHRVHPDDRRLIQEASREALRGEVRPRLGYRAVRPGGEVRFVHSQYELEHDASGRVIGLIGTLQDITEQKRAEEELHRSEERFRSLVQNSLDVVMVADANATVLYYSPSVETVMGYKPEEFLGKNALEATPIHPDDLPQARGIFGYLVENPGINYWMELRMQHANGSWRVIEATANNLLDDPSVGGIVTNYRDITERKVFEKQLEHQALHDDLTGLPNRVLFMNRLEHALARVDRLEGKVAVMFLDLDNFKVVNDGLGHKAGDELLSAVAGRLQRCLRSGDTVARLSGDEFIVLLEEIAKESDATQLAERFAWQLRAPFRLGDQDVYVATSIGIAFGTSSSDHPDELLRKADVAMYRAKSKGKAHYKVFDAYMDAEAHERLKLETDLRQALERGEFRVYYQPKVLLETGEIFDFEALVRWEHPERGLLLPSEFIPIAEESGLIHQIGRWVLRESCQQLHEWQEQKLSEAPIPVGVNLSAKQFQHPDLAKDIVRILQETGVDERLLCLEITESVAMEEAKYTIATLNKLKGLNIRLAIDDFGTGYSSLSYLKSFPVDYLKIDRSIVTGFEKDNRNRAIVLSAITLAHALGLQVVAEGVETAGEFEKLRSLKCDIGQGYYFAHPLPAEAVPSLLARSPHQIGSTGD